MIEKSIVRKTARKPGRGIKLLSVILLCVMVASGLANSGLFKLTVRPAGASASAAPVTARSITPSPRARDNDIQFDRISLDQGLSQSVVNCIFQDSKGFMWLGTQDGLNRYDGYGFVVYKHDAENPDSLSNNFISAIHEDRSGTLWIGTAGGGLDKFDRDTGQFSHHRNDPGDPNSLGGNVVQAIQEDQDGALWVGTNGGLNRLMGDGQFARYLNIPTDPHSLSHNVIQTIYKDRNGTLWIGTSNGLDRFEQAGTEQFTRYMTGAFVQAIHQDQENEEIFWVGTPGGISKLNSATEQFIFYQNDPDDPRSLIGDNVRAIHQDRTGAIWIATGSGLDMFIPTTDMGEGGFERQIPFIHYQNDPNDPHSLGVNDITSIYQDQGGVLWFGMFGGGVNRFDRAKTKFTLYRNNPNDPNSLNHNSIWAIHQDLAQPQVLWIGTRGGGLNRLDREAEEFISYQNIPSDTNSLGDNTVMTLYQDPKESNVLWIGTGGTLHRFDQETEEFTRYPIGATVTLIYPNPWDEQELLIGTLGGGIGVFNRETEQVINYRNNPADTDSLGNNTIRSICQDREESILWIGTAFGLDRYDRDTEQFTHYRNDPDDPGSLSHDGVMALYRDRQDMIWIGTFGGGLDKFDPATETFVHYTERDGLPNNSIYGILADEAEGEFWLSTNNGLSRFDLQTETFKNYSARDGLQSNEFNQGAHHKSSSGEMFFGGIDGFNAFYSDEIRDNPYIPPVVVTDFHLFNESVRAGEDSVLEHPIEETGEIELSYREDFFSFEFAALHFSSPEQNQYAYIMENLDKGWNHIGTRRFAGYTSVPPGEYTFRVKGSNSDGVWNEEGTAIRIVVTPPFWQTWWFITLVTVLVIGSVTGAFVWRIRASEARRRQLEILVDERTKELQETLAALKRSKEAAEAAREAAEAANKAKSVFLANMSHELRTPLNAVLGFTQLMGHDANLTTGQQENLGIINRSGEHLLGLINDVLEMSKIEAGRTTLNAQGFDLHRLLAGLEEMFRLRAKDKGLNLLFEREPDVPQYIKTDEGKLRQVLMNLLGNAVKFTHKGGIALRVAQVNKSASKQTGKFGNGELGNLQIRKLVFEVEDTGPGIAPEELEAVFDPFVQTTSGEQSQEGTGLGMPISRQFACLMNGDLIVNSEPGRGCVFKFEAQVEAVDADAVQTAQPTRRVLGLEAGQSAAGGVPYRLLIVDDKEVNRRLMVKLLAELGSPPAGFEVREASNGQEAIDVWEEWEPHLIWMDMRMPVMDGYEAAQHIKSTIKGQATVIVALTASVLEEDRTVILSGGCDAFIRKPFRESEIFDALTKHLGVRFVYEEIEKDEPKAAAERATSTLPHTELIARLAALPTDWLATLEQATILGDFNAISANIAQIHERDAALAKVLTELAHNFEHDTILDWISQTNFSATDE